MMKYFCLVVHEAYYQLVGPFKDREKASIFEARRSFDSTEAEKVEILCIETSRESNSALHEVCEPPPLELA